MSASPIQQQDDTRAFAHSPNLVPGWRGPRVRLLRVEAGDLPQSGRRAPFPETPVLRQHKPSPLVPVCPCGRSTGINSPSPAPSTAYSIVSASFDAADGSAGHEISSARSPPGCARCQVSRFAPITGVHPSRCNRFSQTVRSGQSFVRSMREGYAVEIDIVAGRFPMSGS